MRIKILTLSLFLFLFFSTFARAEDVAQARSLFYDGNFQYSKENFQQAADTYEKVLGLGYESAALYYNLGNAYYKSGQLGEAILNYMRARELAPNDPDINSNLEYAKTLVKGATTLEIKSFFARTSQYLADNFSLNGITGLTLLFYWLFCLILLGLILIRAWRRQLIYSASVVLVILIFSAMVFAIKFHEVRIEQPAVVVVEEAQSKFEPFYSATTHFILYEGAQVKVLSSENSWYKVRRPDNKIGWVPAESLEIL